MAQDAKISELTTVSGLTGAEVVAIVKDGTTYKGSLTALFNFFLTLDFNLAGNLAVPANKNLSLKSGSGQKAGNTTLIGGTKTVINATVTATTVIYLTRKTAGGTIGNLSYTITDGVSFTINSDSATDTSVVSYLIIENA